MFLNEIIRFGDYEVIVDFEVICGDILIIELRMVFIKVYYIKVFLFLFILCLCIIFKLNFMLFFLREGRGGWRRGED